MSRLSLVFLFIAKRYNPLETVPDSMEAVFNGLRRNPRHAPRGRRATNDQNAMLPWMREISISNYLMFAMFLIAVVLGSSRGNTPAFRRSWSVGLRSDQQLFPAPKKCGKSRSSTTARGRKPVTSQAPVTRLSFCRSLFSLKRKLASPADCCCYCIVIANPFCLNPLSRLFRSPPRLNLSAPFPFDSVSLSIRLTAGIARLLPPFLPHLK